MCKKAPPAARHFAVCGASRTNHTLPDNRFYLLLLIFQHGNHRQNIAQLCQSRGNQRKLRFVQLPGNRPRKSIQKCGKFQSGHGISPHNIIIPHQKFCYTRLSISVKSMISPAPMTNTMSPFLTFSLRYFAMSCKSFI